MDNIFKDLNHFYIDDVIVFPRPQSSTRMTFY